MIKNIIFINGYIKMLKIEELKIKFKEIWKWKKKNLEKNNLLASFLKIVKLIILHCKSASMRFCKKKWQRTKHYRIWIWVQEGSFLD